MPKTKVVNSPAKHRAEGENNALWLFAVSPHYKKDHYSCEYDLDKCRWKIELESSILKGVFALVSQCRHILGWDVPAEGKEAAVQ